MSRLIVALLAALSVTVPAGAQIFAEYSGETTFHRFCASCHGVKTAGTEKGPTFLHRVYHPGHHGDGAFALAARRGARAHHWRFGNMKPVSGVSDEELKEIVGYIRALQKANGVF